MAQIVTEVISILDELDLLEAHLDEHEKFNFSFVIAESKKTVSGLDKPLFFKENEKRFSRFKYEYIEVPGGIFPIAADGHHFTRINDWNKRVWLHENLKLSTPWVMYADVDEIFKFSLFSDWKEALDKNFEYLCLSLYNRYGYINIESSFVPDVYRLCRSDISVEKLKNPKLCKRTHLGKVAWHFHSCFTSAESLRWKAKNRAWYFNVSDPDKVPPLNFFIENRKKLCDPVTGAEIAGAKIVELADLPTFMLNNLDKFPVWKNKEKITS